MRILTMTDEEYTVIERELKGRLGHQEDLGYSGGGAKHALGILARAEEAPREPCAWTGCPDTVGSENEWCPLHDDLTKRIAAVAAQAAGS